MRSTRCGWRPGARCRPRVALRSEIDDLIERWYGQGRSAMGAIVETADGESGDMDDVEHLRDLASEAPVIRLVNLIIQRASNCAHRTSTSSRSRTG